MKLKFILMLVCIILLISGCTQYIPLEDDIATSEGIDNLADANNQFAFDMYSQVKDSDDNIFFSPYSISTALGMVYEGAEGQTAEEIRSVFYFPENDTERRSSFAAIYNILNKEDKEYKLHTGNALWTQEDYSFLQEYIDVVKTYYGAEVDTLDFKYDSDGSAEIINEWVEEKTEDKIQDIISPGVITPDTRAVLANAIYFKGTWLQEFDKSDTEEAKFKVSTFNSVDVDMMSMTSDEAEFNYAEIDDVQILELPYEGEDVSMILLLPEGNNIENLENIISNDKLEEWESQMHNQRVDIYIPKFKMETKYQLAETLAEMGMPSAFSGNADFSGMTGSKDLIISKVIHQAFIEVDEKGTEAAAATVVVMEATSVSVEPKIPEFRADHPFIFIIKENETGSILFLGRVSDPTS